MTNLLGAVSHVRGIGTLGTRSSPSWSRINRKRSPAQSRPFPSQMKHRLEIVANAATGLRVDRVTEEKEPKASWWDTSPFDHATNYVASFMPPGPDRQFDAAMSVRYFFLFWMTGLPLLIWLCPGLRTVFVPAFLFIAVTANVAYWFNRICTGRIAEKEFIEMLERDLAEERRH